MKRVGLVLLFGGFLAGSFLATQLHDGVNWGLFAVAGGAMLVGLVCVRIAAKSHGDDAGVHEASVQSLLDNVGQVVTRLEAMTTNKDDIFVYDVHGKIDAELAQPLADFADARESMIPLYGMKRYADVMSAFAVGERNINRAWSASADGYVDEVWASLTRAEALMREAQAQLASAKAA